MFQPDMDFSFRKPTHLLALFALLIAFFLLIGLSALAYFGIGTTSSSQISSVPASMQLYFEVFALLIQILIVVIGIFLFVPFLWYTLVNKFTFRQMLEHIQLRKSNLKKAILWGIIAVFIAFALEIIVNLVVLQITNANPESLSNIPDLLQFFSPATLFILVAVQPIGEEIFFRGFLLDKFTALSGPYTAVLITAILFGLSHLSYGMAYTTIVAGILGVIFGLAVIRTKNLTTSIVAHIIINLTGLSLYFINKSLGF
jgi:membrane protease YdiL (CAAX protease family)